MHPENEAHRELAGIQLCRIFDAELVIPVIKFQPQVLFTRFAMFSPRVPAQLGHKVPVPFPRAMTKYVI